MNQITVPGSVSPIHSVSPAPSECLRQLLWYHAAKEKQLKVVRASVTSAPRAEVMKCLYQIRDKMPITIVELREVSKFSPGALGSQISALIKCGYLTRTGKRLSAVGLRRRVIAFSFTEKGLEYARTC